MPSQVITFRASDDLVAQIDARKNAWGFDTRSNLIVYILKQVFTADQIAPPDAPKIDFQENPILKLKQTNPSAPSLISRTLKLAQRALQCTYGDLGEGPVYVRKTAKAIMAELEKNPAAMPSGAAVKIYQALLALEKADFSPKSRKQFEAIVRELNELKPLEAPA